MADVPTDKPLDSAEKAFAEAAEAAVVLPALNPAPAEAPVKAPAPVVPQPAAKVAKPAKAPEPAPKVAAKVAPKVTPPAANVAKVVAPEAPPKVLKPAPVAKPATKPTKTTAASSGKPVLSTFKDTIMAKTETDITAAFTTAFADLQGKAKEAYEKGTAGLGEATDFAKGNVEALVESGKIFVEGAKSLGTDLVAESKSAIETISADAKELAAVKSPADFFKFQSELMRRNFDAVVATASKNTEAMFKLANQAIAPLSTRATLAMEKVGKAA